MSTKYPIKAKTEELTDVLDKAVCEINIPSYNPTKISIKPKIAIPKSYDHGDFFSNYALQVSASSRYKAIELAELIAAKISNNDPDIAYIKAIEPGYINFFLKDEWFYKAFLEADTIIDQLIQTHNLNHINLPQNLINIMTTRDNENPLQYAHARISTIIRLLTSENLSIKCLTVDDIKQLNLYEEKQIIRMIISLPDNVQKITRTEKLIDLGYDLYSSFDKYYSNVKLRGKASELTEINLKNARVTLISVVQKSIKLLLTLSGFESPERL